MLAGPERLWGFGLIALLRDQLQSTDGGAGDTGRGACPQSFGQTTALLEELFIGRRRQKRARWQPSTASSGSLAAIVTDAPDFQC